jgi:hypothetical protein
MKTPTSIVTSVRLAPERFTQFRFLMQRYGRAWLERIIDREHVKANKPKSNK